MTNPFGLLFDIPMSPADFLDQTIPGPVGPPTAPDSGKQFSPTGIGSGFWTLGGFDPGVGKGLIGQHGRLRLRELFA